ncbi:MAG: Gfo/Idh/MocA family oxidoreductase [Chloroflexi bacterium]|nr:Gfo/Idh/MocA family oxidoreductase [Chloroflexota bacterium]
MAKYRAALIGLGRIASTIDDEVRNSPLTRLPYSHMACYRAVPEIEVVAGADLYPEQREAFKNRWGLDNMYADYREMLAKEKPDIVSVTTSAKPRPGIVIDCANAKVPLIFAEKPLAFSLAEADAMLAACDKNGSKVAVGCTRRWDAYWNSARDLIDSGELGQVLQVTGYGRAGISHNGSHLIDLIRYLAGGHVKWVFGEMESDEKAAGDEDMMGNGYLAFDNGARAYARMMPSGGAEWAFEVVGENGHLRSVGDGREIEWWQKKEGGARRELEQRQLTLPQDIRSPGYRAVLDFIKCLDTGKEPTCSGVDGREALETAIALRQSHRQGGSRVDLPLADRSLYIRSQETLQGDLPQAFRRR